MTFDSVANVLACQRLGMISKIEAKCCFKQLKVEHDVIDRLLGEVTDVYVVVTHRPSGRQYTLDRAYRLNPECPRFADEFLKTAVETWDGYSNLAQPDWAASLPASEFFAHWMY
jgi:hypothetical protein